MTVRKFSMSNEKNLKNFQKKFINHKSINKNVIKIHPQEKKPRFFNPII